MGSRFLDLAEEEKLVLGHLYFGKWEETRRLSRSGFLEI